MAAAGRQAICCALSLVSEENRAGEMQGKREGEREDYLCFHQQDSSGGSAEKGEMQAPPAERRGRRRG